jgi:hypothetical protein
MSEEERIRELCIRVVNAKESDETAVSALRSSIKQYLEDQSDELVLADLLKMPDIAEAIKKKFPAA